MAFVEMTLMALAPGALGGIASSDNLPNSDTRNGGERKRIPAPIEEPCAHLYEELLTMGAEVLASGHCAPFAEHDYIIAIRNIS